MNMSQRANQIMKQWALLFGLLILLHILLFGGLLIIEPSRSVPLFIALMVIYLILFVAISVFFVIRLNAASSPIEYREAREHGLPATAKVLEIERTRWRHKRSRNFRLQVRPQEFEYQMRVRVSRDGVADYEVPLAEFLTGDQVPKKGAVIPIKVHPQHPEVIVMVLDTPSQP